MTRLLRGSALMFAAITLLVGCSSTEPVKTEGRPPPAPKPGGTVWVANEGENTVTVFDAETGNVITTMNNLAAPHNVQASALTKTVWVTTAGGVVAIDAERLFATGVAPAGDHPAHVVEGADGQVYVTASGDGVVHHLTPSLEAGHKIEVGGGPHGMRVSADGATGVVANTTAGTLDVLDLRAGTKVASVPVGPSPIQVAIAPDAATAYVAVAGDHKIVRVDLNSQKVNGHVSVASAPAQIWLTASGLLLSANQGTEADPGTTVSIIDADTMTVQNKVITGSGPHGITMNTDETTAWVTNSFDGTVSVIDLAQAKVVATVTVGKYPNGITFFAGNPTLGVGPQVALLVPPRYSGEVEGEGDGHEDHSHGAPESGGHDH